MTDPGRDRSPPRPVCGLPVPWSERTPGRRHSLPDLTSRTFPDPHSPDAATHVLPSVHLFSQVEGSWTKWISGFQDKMFYHEPETILEVAHYLPTSPVSKQMSYTEQRMLLTATVTRAHCHPSREKIRQKNRALKQAFMFMSLYSGQRQRMHGL